jgi:fatty acid desaturase
MRLRYAADLRTLLWLFFAACNCVAIWMLPTMRMWLLPVACYFALSAGIIAHNHNHSPTFKSRTANEVLNHVATLFYGFAAFNWVPTHNQNHHKFTNAEGDATITWRHSNKHNAFVAFTYPFVSAYFQAPLIDRYVKDAKARKPKLFKSLVVQLVICWGLPVVLTFVDWRATLISLWIPRFFSLWTIMWFNYGQHVHCDPFSKWNHSRNFTSPVLNFLLFNNGLHTIHHMKPGSHWSVAKELHAEVESNIDPELNQKSLIWWMVKCYLLAIVAPSVGTQQVGRAPFDPPPRFESVEEMAANEGGQPVTAAAE